jgi:cyclopropane-fatty-acyl-phospholipid synthase
LKRRLAEALRAVAERTTVPFRIVFANGSEFQSGPETPQVVIHFRTAAAEWRAAVLGYVGFLEGYYDEQIDVDGNFALAFRAGMEGGFDRRSSRINSIRNWWHELRYSNRSIAQAKKNAEFHYAIGTDFYRYWLDQPYMMYTCAYWKEGTRTLEEAQQNKMEHVCRKLQLSRGERFIDIGCGWGGFTFYAWERYGALGTGLNITGEQVQTMRREIRRRSLEGTIDVVEADFRQIPGEFDKSVSIGTLEHAGRDQIDEVVRAHAASVKRGGLGMLHFIGHVGHYETDFPIRNYIFPGGWIPSLAETIVAMERAGLEILDIENLRRHYALTLDSWGQRFDQRWPEIQALDPARFTERFRRRWSTYLHACAEMFRSPHGYTHLFQILYSKGNVRNNFPMSRAHLYVEKVIEESRAQAA